jgi:hypothetical protein
MKKNYFLLLSFLLIAGIAQAQVQSSEEVKEIIDYATPSVEGQGRSKGIVLGYERLPQFDIKSNSDNPQIGNGNGRVRINRRFDARAFVPIMNRPRAKLIFGIGHRQEEFNFSDANNYSLYKNLEDKNLKSTGIQVAYLRSLDEKKFYLFRISGELNGDYNTDDVSLDNYLKTTFDAVYGWKKNPYFSWGVGLQFGYTYGRRSVLPAILYNRTYNNKWGVESIFPANIIVRRNISEKTLLFAGYKLEGASYTLNANEGALAAFNPIELRRTDVKGLFRLEQEIHDFLWFGVEGGYRRYLRNRVYDNIGSSTELIENDLAGAGYVRVELFVVPPRKMLERKK